MFRLNGKEVNVIKFPDGSCKVDISNCDIDYCFENNITWLYDGDDEVFQLINIVELLKKRINIEDYRDYKFDISLIVPYFPNARMDRVKDKSNESFTLKIFCDLIKRMEFDRVEVFDPHSSVTELLLGDNFDLCQSHKVIFNKVNRRLNNDFILFYPDEGARKRYDYKMPSLCGFKNRDWETGKILDLEVVGNKDLVKGRDVLIMDDISSYGRTFLHSAQKLKELGANDVYLFVSHCENSILEGDLYKSGLIKKVFTTNSIYRGNDPWVEVVHEF